ncbi:MAG: hypothetical protein AABX93_01875 [Nanoarchaeota archaeon]
MKALKSGENYIVHFDRKLGELDKADLFKCWVEGDFSREKIYLMKEKDADMGIQAILTSRSLKVSIGGRAYNFLQMNDFLECPIENSKGILKIVYKELGFDTQY